MYKKFRDAEDSSIKFELVNAAGDLFAVVIPSVRFSGETPTIDDDTGIRLTMNFQAKYSEADETDMYIILTNTIPTI